MKRSKKAPKRKAGRAKVTIKSLASVIGNLDRRLEDVCERVNQRAFSRPSVFGVRDETEHGSPVFTDGSTQCLLCKGVKLLKHVSPRGACMSCLGAEIAALSNGQTAKDVPLKSTL
jgi:hypothetical protein